MKILTGKNHPVLRRIAKKISSEEAREYKELAAKMIVKMYEASGIGLAAPQIGESLALAVVDAPEPLVLINPRITWESKETIPFEEGCLSLPGMFGTVKRPKSVRIKALNLDGKGIEFKAKGLLARIFQHEIDHLNGTLFIDKASRMTRT